MLHIREPPQNSSSQLLPQSSPSMSTSPSLQASDPSSSSSSNGNSGGGGSSQGMSQGANYFFGFLITFVVLLLVFVACGISSRRYFFYRGRGSSNTGGGGFLGNVAAEWGASSHQHQSTKPMFWEAWLQEGGQKWSTMVPLSASVLRRKGDGAHSSRLRGANFFRRKSSLRADSGGANGDDPPEVLQLAVMISMPSSPATHRDKQPPPKEYQIGIACVPWPERVEP